MSLLSLYQKYLRAGDHRCKLRIIRLLERLLIPVGGRVFDAPHGFRMHLDPIEVGEYELIKGRTAEPLTLSFLERNIEPGNQILIAGVTNAIDVMIAARRAGPSGVVVGVEPQPFSLQRASRNCELNQLNNVRLVSGGLGESATIVPLGEVPRNSVGWSSYVTRAAGSCPYQTQIDTVPSFLSRLHLRPELDLMLLDVEGYELPILRGLGSLRPRKVIIEVHPPVLELVKMTQDDYYSALSKLGYSLFDLHGTPASPGSAIPESNLIGLQSGEAVTWIDYSQE
jgi:FkbM family methyltransferase